MGIANEILEANKGVLDGLETLFDLKKRQASSDTKGGKFTEDACKVAETIAVIRRDAYAVQSSDESRTQMAMAAMLGGARGQGTRQPNVPGPTIPPDMIATAEKLSKKIKGGKVGRQIPPEPAGGGDAEPGSKK